MKKICLFAMTLMAVTVAKAQTLDEIISKHIEAMGGKDKLASIKTIHMEGVIVGANGNEITISIWKEHNKLFRREINFGMGTGITLITDKGGWNTDRQGNVNPMKDEQYHRQEFQLDCQSPLVDYAAKGHKAELMGKETADGKDYYKIKLTLKGGNEQFYFIEASTYYLDHLSFKAGSTGMGGGPGMNPDAEIVVKYSNYAKTDDGYIFPFTTTTTGGFGGSLNYEKIEVNKPVEESKYKAQ
ncbi:MAG: hypothetical protein HYR66_10850 [Sphingobacteriales bacterium]|nr:hypothetical protein [Sphingobacteriales bacterium]MBI3717011.1 hypothetical protein [Sphingobacteriales bacterium]